MLLATPLHVAAYYGSLDAVKALIDFKAKVFSSDFLSPGGPSLGGLSLGGLFLVRVKRLPTAAASRLSKLSSTSRPRYRMPMHHHHHPSHPASVRSRITHFFVFFTLVTGPRRSLSLKLGDTRVYEPHIRARLGTTAHFCEAQHPTISHQPFQRQETIQLQRIKTSTLLLPPFPRNSTPNEK